MSQHVDVILTRQNSKLEKQVYFTLIQRCNQDLKHSLAIVNHVGQQIHEDFPHHTTVYQYMKSDNASYYCGNAALEGEFVILKTHHLNLKRHDFNEPQNGKDQSNRESAKAQHCRTVYLNAGNDIQLVEDVKASFH